MDGALPEVAGHVVSRMALADAGDWAEFAVLPRMQEFTSLNASTAADLHPMIERTFASDPGAPVLFAVRETGTGRLAATFGFHTVSALNKTAEITYQVRPELWGRGLATALCAAGVRWAFAERGWVRVQATVLAPNIGSRRVLEKCGFAYEGTLRSFRIVRGEPRDYLLFATVAASR